MIQCVGLNPVYQKTLTIENFVPNTVNRARPDILEGSAGKGINVARTLKTLGHTPVVTGFLGGGTGEMVQKHLLQEGLAFDFVPTSNATRTCFTILDPLRQTQTEIVEEGKPVSSDEVQQMYHVYERHLQKCQLVTICGTAPQQVPEEMYFQFVQAAHNRRIPVLLDTQKQMLLLSLKAHPFLIKINREELGAAFHVPVETDNDLRRLINDIHSFGVEWVVITQGKDATLVSQTNTGMWTVSPPAITPVNPIGSGDATLGGIAAAIVEGRPVLEAIRLGTACGTANALTLKPGCVRPEDIRRLETEVSITRQA